MNTKLCSSLLVFLLLFANAVARGNITKTIVVDLNGGGNFRSVQEAINSVPSGNKEWIKIKIKSGHYREKVIVPDGKGYLLFDGEGPKSTVISWDDHEVMNLYSNSHHHRYDHHYRSLLHIHRDFRILNRRDSATFAVWAENVVLQGITFENPYGRGGFKAKAVAVTLGADKIAAYKCHFIGIQDTLNDLYYRHYFKGCYIEGAVDFIWGFGQSLYEGCKIKTVETKRGSVGWVTAHGRSKDDSTGFVFKNCVVWGRGKTYLGRAWGPKSKVIFYKTNMSSNVLPKGWDNNKYDASQLTFVERDNFGPGSRIKQRVQWRSHLRGQKLYSLVDKSFVDDGWIQQQPRK